MGSHPVAIGVGKRAAKAVRRWRLDANFRDALHVDLVLLNIETDPDMDAFAWSTSLQLAQAHQMIVDNAAYLELAKCMTRHLAKPDQALRYAGESAGVVLFGL